MTGSQKRRTVARTLFALVTVVGLSTGCVGQQTPGGYGDSVEEDFVRGCTTTSTDDGATFADGTAFEPAEFCQCAYDALSGDGGVPFDDFKQVTDDQIDGPGPLPDSFTEVYASCQEPTTTSTEAQQDTTTSTTAEG